MTNTEIIQHIYDRLIAGDAKSIFARFDPEIEFRLAEGHPYQPGGASWRGHEAVMKNFFVRAGDEWESWRVLVQEIFEASGAVIVECRYAGVYRPTGRPLDAQACHIWKLRDGNVTSFHQYINTAHLHDVMTK